MSIHINLLQNQRDYTKLENAFRIARVGIALLGVICLVTLGLLFALKRNAQQLLNQSISQRNLLQQNINSLQEQEASIVLINEKMASMNTILNGIPDYSRQVETILAYVPSASDSGKIDNLALEGKSATLTISFPGVLELSRFLTVVESDQFQSHFNSVRIDSLSLKNLDSDLIMTVHVTF